MISQLCHFDQFEHAGFNEIGRNGAFSAGLFVVNLFTDLGCLSDLGTGWRGFFATLVHEQKSV